MADPTPGLECSLAPPPRPRRPRAVSCVRPRPPAWPCGIPPKLVRGVPTAARALGHGVSACRARAPVTTLTACRARAPMTTLTACRARAPMTALTTLAPPWRILSPILVTSWALCCYVHPGCFAATCYGILSPLLPARMSPGMQLTAEVPAGLSSALRIVVRYANKNGDCE